MYPLYVNIIIIAVGTINTKKCDRIPLFQKLIYISYILLQAVYAIMQYGKLSKAL